MPRAKAPPKPKKTAAAAAKRGKKSQAKAIKEVVQDQDENVSPIPMMAKVLDDAQRSVASHTRCLASMCKLYRQNPKGFLPELTPYLNKILLVFKKEPSIDRLLSFISAFVTQADLLNEQEDKLKNQHSTRS